MQTSNEIINEITNSIKLISLDVGFSYLDIPDFSIADDGKSLAINKKDKSEKYCSISEIISPQITFTVMTIFSKQSAYNILKTKYPVIENRDEIQVSLDIVREYVNILAGSFMSHFKYPEKFTISGPPSLISADSIILEPSALIASWFLVNEDKGILLHPSLLCYNRISEEIFGKIILHKNQSNEIEIF
ncbi:MAG: hypothetical protein HQK54_03805 [Oligoflexales bacterium]|nr:hypothetical protein [Oligoflexales bacterium]